MTHVTPNDHPTIYDGFFSISQFDCSTSVRPGLPSTSISVRAVRRWVLTGVLHIIDAHG